MSLNGMLKSAELRKVAGVPLSLKTANAFENFVAYAKKNGKLIAVALPAGGYRDYFTQGDMRIHPVRYNLNPNSGASLAAPGLSTHGFGTAVDIISSDFAWVLANAGKFGFYRSIPGDPNHFQHDGKTAVDILDEDDADRIHDNKVKAMYLNTFAERWGLGKTGTSKDGKRRESYWKLVKRWGQARSIYTGKITGVGPTDATAKIEKAMWDDAVAWFKEQ